MIQDKLVVFDLGGVVIDIDFARIWRFWTDASGVDLISKAQLLGPASGDNDAFHRFERGEISESEFYKLTAERTGVELSPDQWRSGWNALFLGEFPGTQALLHELTGMVRLMGLSNINAPHHAVATGRFGHLLGHFESIVFSHEVGLRKPEKAIFDMIAQRSSVAPERILFFDDMIANVNGAKAAGLQAKLFTTAAQARRDIHRFLGESN